MTQSPNLGRRPRFPFWKDEKAFGNHGPKTASALRMLIIAVALAMIILGAAVIYVSTQVSDVRSGVQQVHRDQNQGHASRLHDQRKMQLQIQENKQLTRDLACATVKYLSNNKPPATPYLRFLNSRYDCANYVPPKNKPFPEPPPTDAPSPSPTH